jgi:hypothetical protein
LKSLPTSTSPMLRFRYRTSSDTSCQGLDDAVASRCHRSVDVRRLSQEIPKLEDW